MTARRKVVGVVLAGLRSGQCGWGARLRQQEGHQNDLLGLDVHDSSPTVNTSAGTATGTDRGFKSSRWLFDDPISTDSGYGMVKVAACHT